MVSFIQKNVKQTGKYSLMKTVLPKGIWQKTFTSLLQSKSYKENFNMLLDGIKMKTDMC